MREVPKIPSKYHTPQGPPSIRVLSSKPLGPPQDVAQKSWRFSKGQFSITYDIMVTLRRFGVIAAEVSGEAGAWLIFDLANSVRNKERQRLPRPTAASGYAGRSDD